MNSKRIRMIDHAGVKTPREPDEISGLSQ